MTDPAVALACRRGISLQAARAILARSPVPGDSVAIRAQSCLDPSLPEPGKSGGRGERPSTPSPPVPAAPPSRRRRVNPAPAAPGPESGPDHRETEVPPFVSAQDTGKADASPAPTPPPLLPPPSGESTARGRRQAELDQIEAWIARNGVTRAVDYGALTEPIQVLRAHGYIVFRLRGRGGWSVGGRTLTEAQIRKLAATVAGGHHHTQRRGQGR